MAQFFNLTLDTTAPSSGVLSGLQAYYNSNPTVTIAAANASFMKVWATQNAAGTTSDTNYPTSWEVYGTSKTLTLSSSNTYYIHAQFMDEVGNISSIVDSNRFIYDTIAPTVSAVSINNGDGYTKVASNTVRVTFADSGQSAAQSGVGSITLSGNIATAEATTYILSDADRTAGYKDFTITFSGADGIKTVTATATDRAGNTSSAASDTIVYDTTAATITPILREEDDSANLPSYVNYRDYGVRIVTDATDITDYKVWEGDTEPASWTDISNATAVSGVGYFIDNLELSSGDGTKTIHVKIQDIAGNVTTGTALSTTLDTTAPVVTLSASTAASGAMISAVSGYNTVTFTCGATDTNSAQGMTYELKCGGTTIKSGSFTSTVQITQSEIAAISPGQGNKSFVLYVTDVAGNTGNSTAIVVTVDTEAPTFVLLGEQECGPEDNVVFSLRHGSGAGAPGVEYSYAPVEKIKYWLDGNTEPSEWSNYPSTDVIDLTNNVSEGKHIIHVKVKDIVGNVSETVNHDFIYDTTAPAGTITTNSYTNSRSITINISASDTTYSYSGSGFTYSPIGLTQMKVWEDGTSEPSWETYATSKSITLTTGDGQKTINAKFIDYAGNESEEFTCTTTLDTDEPDVTLVLTKTDGTTTLPAHVNLVGFNARIGFTNETQDSPIVEYKLTGDFTDSSDTWQTFTADSGKSYMTISNLQFTSGDGIKTITALLKDSAGNVSAIGASVTTTYDSAPPVIDVNTPDYSIVSKQHTLRLDNTGNEITGKYNDMCTFTWSANEALQAFKVCVNGSGQTAQDATAIGITNGSQNMSGGAIEANTDVTSVIFGADFADIVNDIDGAYEIIVYGQDLAGTWSAVHVIADSSGGNAPS